jgi:small neutral amino acid transporter SnatA (MarC family)
MLQIRSIMCEGEGRLYRKYYSHLVFAFVVGAGCLIAASTDCAAEVAGSRVPLKQFPAAQVFTFLFLMLGPFKIIGPFAKVTKGADARLTRQIAVWATIFSTLALLIAAVLGESFLSKYGIPLPVLALSAGIILFLVALKNVLDQFVPSEPRTDQGEVALAASAMKIALAPLAFPTIVTPYGIATLVVFLAFSQNVESTLTIGAIVVAIMLLNLIVMLVTRRLLPVLALVLPILGAVLGVIQVALGLQIINNSLRALELL